MTKVDTEKYIEFVKGVTSDPSLDYAAFLTRTNSLEIQEDCNVTQLLTAALGLAAESGEFTEVVKKIIFQGKPYNCLLYTSPSPRDQRGSRMPSSA